MIVISTESDRSYLENVARSLRCVTSGAIQVASSVLKMLQGKNRTKLSADFVQSKGSPTQNEHQLRVLLVEDSPLQQKAIVHVLQQLGHTVNLANDGFEALSAVQMDSCYDVILMDCEMPLMNGFQSTRFIRELQRITGQQTGIIGISASASADECFMAGMDDFLSKPLNKLILRAVLGRWIRKKKGTSERAC